jgi:hypothetical protein
MVTAKKPSPKKQQDKLARAIPSGKQRLIRGAIGAAIFLFIVNLLTGWISYAAMTVWCLRPPITASRFAASDTYFKPGHPGYGPDMFSEYYCTAHDAERAGFNPSPWE